MHDDNRELLYRSFDASLSEQETNRLEEALAQSAELRAEKVQIETMRQAAADSATPGFSKGFSSRVMRRIAQIENPDVLFFESLYAVFKPVAIAAAVLIISFATYNMHTTQQVSLSGIMALSEVSVLEAFDPAVTFSLESIR